MRHEGLHGNAGQGRRGPVAAQGGLRHVGMLSPPCGKEARPGNFLTDTLEQRTGKPGYIACGMAQKALDAPLCALKLHGHRFMTDRSAPRRGGLRSAGCIGRGGGRGGGHHFFDGRGNFGENRGYRNLRHDLAPC